MNSILKLSSPCKQKSVLSDEEKNLQSMSITLKMHFPVSAQYYPALSSIFASLRIVQLLLTNLTICSTKKCKSRVLGNGMCVRDS
jgi:hypothetical protein